jgi:cytoskeletal protein CcmA (bactofilin family)
VEENKEERSELETLEDQDTQVTGTPDTNQENTEKAVKPKGQKGLGVMLSKISTRLNVYLLAFILIIIICGIIVFVVVNTGNQQEASQDAILTEELTQEAIDNLTSNESTVGDPKQLLTVESNSVFNGRVLIRDGLDVAGPIKVGGALSLPGITVSGTSQFDEVLLNALSIAGDANVQGTLTVENNISVAGEASFGGNISAPSITIDALQISGDISFSRHIDAGGATPSVTNGGSAGSGSTVSISGTDTAGTVTINVGSGSSAGTLAVVSFAVAFSGNPHVVITPVTTSPGTVSSGDFYLSNRSTTGFSIASATPVSSGSISFDYIVID